MAFTNAIEAIITTHTALGLFFFVFDLFASASLFLVEAASLFLGNHQEKKKMSGINGFLPKRKEGRKWEKAII